MEKNMTERLLEWYATGETGLSSQAIAKATAGLSTGTHRDGRMPSDAWDLRRCILLLRKVPEAYERGVLVLATRHAGWKVLAANWPQLEKTLVSELGEALDLNADTPRTYKMISELTDEVRFGGGA